MPQSSTFRFDFGQPTYGLYERPDDDPIGAVGTRVPETKPVLEYPDAPGLVEKGNVDLNSRPEVPLQDGKTATLKSASFNIDGVEVLVPTVSEDGRLLTEDEALDLYKRTGKHLGKFKSPDAATFYAKRLSKEQGTRYGQRSGTTDPDIDKIIGIESSGDTTAKNPRSSATGLGQFIESTWMDMVKKHRPDLLQGRTRQQVLDLRNDGDLSKEMTGYYTQENVEALRRQGLPVLPETKYLSHFLGAGGAASVLRARPGTALSDVLPASVIKANPHLRGKSNTWVIGWARRKMSEQSGEAAPVSPARQQFQELEAKEPGRYQIIKKADYENWRKDWEANQPGLVGTAFQTVKEWHKGLLRGAAKVGGGTALQGISGFETVLDQKSHETLTKYRDQLARLPEMNEAEASAWLAQMNKPSSQGGADLLERYFLSQAVQDIRAGRLTPEQIANLPEPKATKDRQLYKKGEEVKQWAEETFGADPAWKDGITAQLSEGVGSFLAGLPAAVAGPVSGAAFFTTLGVGEATDRAVAYQQKMQQAVEKARAEGLPEEEIAALEAKTPDEKQVALSALYGIAPGATDLIPAETLLYSLKVPRAAHKPLLDVIKHIGGQAFIEGIQEGGQGILQNWIAQGVYNPDQSLVEGVPHDAAVGFGVGGIVQTGVEVIKALLPGRQRGAGQADQPPVDQPAAEPAAPPGPLTGALQRGGVEPTVAPGQFAQILNDDGTAIPVQVQSIDEDWATVTDEAGESYEVPLETLTPLATDPEIVQGGPAALPGPEPRLGLPAPAVRMPDETSGPAIAMPETGGQRAARTLRDERAGTSKETAEEAKARRNAGVTTEFYEIEDAIDSAGPEKIQFTKRESGVAYIMRGDQLIDVSAMVKAGFTPERIIAQSIGETTDGSKVRKAERAGTREAPVPVETPEDVTVAEGKVNTEPTEGQKEAGNYQKGHLKLAGLNITIENPRGSERSGTGGDGTPWSVTMPAAYGYVKGTEGRDGDQVDVYIGDAPTSERVFVVDQIDAETGKFDEHKAMVGFDTPEAARGAYEAAFSDGRGAERLGALTEMPVAEFKDWLGKGKRSRPVGEIGPQTASATAPKNPETEIGAGTLPATPVKTPTPAPTADDLEIPAFLRRPQKGKQRIEQSAGQGVALQYPTYEAFLTEARKAGASDEEIATASGIRNEADFLRVRDEEISEFVEAPVQDLVRQVYKEGGSPFSSNAYGPGRKGVEYEDTQGNRKFKPLEPEPAPEPAPLQTVEQEMEAARPAFDEFIAGKRRIALLRKDTGIPEGVATRLLGEAVKAGKLVRTKSGGYMRAADVEARKARLEAGQAKAKPVTTMLKAMGGVDPDSPLAGDLRAMGVTAKNAPGLFKRGGRGAIDNIPASEHPLFANDGDSRGYIKEDVLKEALVSEVVNKAPRLSREDQEAEEIKESEADHERARAEIKEAAERRGLGRDEAVLERALSVYATGVSAEEAVEAAAIQLESETRNDTDTASFQDAEIPGDWGPVSGPTATPVEELPQTRDEGGGEQGGAEAAVPASEPRPSGGKGQGRAQGELGADFGPISEAEQAQRGADKPLKPDADQKPADEGLFSDDSQQTDLVDEARKPAKATGTYGASNTLVTPDRAEELRKRLKAKLAGQLSAGIDPEVLAIGAELTVFHIEAGSRKFVDVAKALAGDLETTVGKLRPYLRSWYNGARDMMEDRGLDIEGMDGPDQVRAALADLDNPVLTAPEGHTILAIGLVKDPEEARIKGGTHTVVVRRESPYSSERGYGDTPEAALQNALARLEPKAEPKPKPAPTDRETWKDGRWKAKPGDKVYQRVPGFGGSAAVINGEVYGKSGALRVKITGANSLIGGGYSGPKTVLYDHAWTVEGDPLPAKRQAEKEAEAKRLEQEIKDDYERRDKDARAKAKAAIAAGDAPLTEENAKAGLVVFNHGMGERQVIGEVGTFKEGLVVVFTTKVGEENEAPRSAGPLEYYSVPAVKPEASPQITLAKKLVERIYSGKNITAKMLQEDGEAAYGGTMAEGKFDRKDTYDALELAVNLTIREDTGMWAAMVPGWEGPQQKIARLLERLPKQTVRSEEQQRFQQFSTPPTYAHAAAYVANVRPGDVVMEPSAGTGSLIAPIIGAPDVSVIANELSEGRAPLLRELVGNKGRVFNENAEQINNVLPADVKPTVVIMNPPFSQTAGRMGDKRDINVGAKHIEQALGRLEPGGRLVAIVGRGMTMGAPRFRKWWDGISQKHAVRANIGVDGQVYAKYGTTFGTRLLVIDKVAPDGTAPVLADVQSVSDLMAALEAIRNERTQPSAELSPAQPGSVEVAETGERAGGAASPARPDAGVVRPGQRGAGGLAPEGTRDTEDTARPPRRDEPASGDAVAGGQPGGLEPGAAASRPARGAKGGGRSDARGGKSAQSDLGGAAEQVSDPANRVGLEHVKPGSQRATDSELSDNLYEDYRPQKVRVKGAKPHPGPLVQSAAMASVEPPTPTYKPALPASVIETGALSEPQLEAVVYAGQAHQSMLPMAEGDTPIRRGFFIGDGTGVGKGREIAGIILDNFLQGRKKAVWVSEKAKLITDAKRDWKGLGQDANQIFNLGKVKTGESVGAGDGILFATYDTMKEGKSQQEAVAAGGFARGESVRVTVDGAQAAGTIAGKAKKGGVYPVDLEDGTRVEVKPDSIERTGGSASLVSRLDQIVEWVGEDFDGVIAFDESHGMGNAVPMKGKRGDKKPSDKALAGLDLQSRLPNARIVYVSATGATEVSNLAYAERLGLWGRGTAFASVSKFINDMMAGGIAAMEVVARDMKAMGSYIARNLSYDGVEYTRLEHVLDQTQRENYDTIAEAWQVILNNFNAALEATEADGRARGQAYSALWGSQQRIFNQVITSMQTPSVIKAIEKDLAEGRQVLIQLTNTNEAQQEKALGKQTKDDDLDDLDMSPKQSVIDLVERSFPTIQYEEFIDENGNKRKRPVVDSAGKPVESREAIAMREALIDRLASVRLPDSPLDMILNHFGTDVVSEVTGRGRRLVYKQDEKTGEMKRVLENRPASANQAETDAFQGGEKKILIFSEAGGTGASYHADNSSKSKDARRVHYLLQAGWRADKALQGLGRGHRTNQASAPILVLVTTDLKGQKRFISSIARRLSQLGALTKGQRQAGDQGIFTARDNLESSEAKDALTRFFQSLYRNEIEGVTIDEFEAQTGLRLRQETTGALLEELPDIMRFLNRLLSLKIDMQNRVFDAFTERLDAVIEQREQAGLLDAGLETIKADKIEKASEQTVYTMEESGAETKYVKVTLANKFKPTAFDPVASHPKRLRWYKSPKGRVYAAIDVPSKTHARTGHLIEQYRLISPVASPRLVERTTPDKGKDWSTIEDAEAQSLWEAETTAAPEFVTHDMHLITGAILPIWDRIGGSTRVVRLQTTEGERLIGRVVPPGQVASTLRNLGAEGGTVEVGDLYTGLMAGNPATLANGWKIKRSLVAGEHRIEITGPQSYSEGEEIKKDGVFSERINYTVRYFVPTEPDAAAKTLEAITKHRPVVEMGAGQADQGESFDEVGSSFGLKIDAKAQASLEKQITALVRKFVGPNYAIDLQETIPEQSTEAYRADTDAAVQIIGGRPKTVGGSARIYPNGAALIRIATRDPGYDPLDTAVHEPYHVAAAFLQTDAERAVIQKHMPRIRSLAADHLVARGFDKDKAKQVTDALPAYEAEAIAAEGYARLRGSGSPISKTRLPRAVAMIFEKFRRMIAAVRDVLSRNGYKRWEDIYEDFYQGRMAGRSPRNAPRRFSEMASGLPNERQWELRDELRDNPNFFDALVRAGKPRKDGAYPFFAADIMTVDAGGYDGDLYVALGTMFKNVLRAKTKAEAAEKLGIPDPYAGLATPKGGQRGEAETAHLAADKVLGDAAKAAGYDAIYFGGREVQVLDQSALPRLEELSYDEADGNYTVRGRPWVVDQGADDYIARTGYGGESVASSIPSDRLARDTAQDRQEQMGRDFGTTPLDNLIRIPFDVFGGTNNKGEWKPGLKLSEKAANIITNAKFDEGSRFAFMNPVLHKSRAGLVDRYGLDPAYVERERQRGLDERRIMAQIPELMKTLKDANIGTEEAKALQAILTGEALPDAEWAKISEPIRNAIDQLGQDAVELGLLSAESYERNKGSYLHRVYLKHENDQSGLARMANRIMGSRRQKILGEQFKGRGQWVMMPFHNLKRQIKGLTFPENGEKFRIVKVTSEPRDGNPGRSRRIFLREGDPVPVDGVDLGLYEVRGRRGGAVVLWRDWTKDEREQMGEIVDARYTIAKTYMLMANDLSTGKFFRDIAQNPDWTWDETKPPPNRWMDASEYRWKNWADPDIEWIRVPDVLIPKSQTKRYGALAGKFVRAEIWRDLNELDKMQRDNLWSATLKQWKLNKTARSPVVHMNNIMSNVLLMDMAGVGMSDLVQGLRSMLNQDARYQEAVDAGAFGADMISVEMRENVLRPLLDEIEADMLDKADDLSAKASGMGKLANAIWGAGLKFDRNMRRLYQMEDEVFRMATFIRRRRQGSSSTEAALEARDQFLNYDIRAPWINAARRTVLPFLSYTYRAAPIVARTIATRPWKIAKYAALAYGFNALAYSLFPGDEDEERRSMREGESGYVWIGAPRMLRMPFGDSYGNPVFLDIRRWIPAGDVFDMTQGHSAFNIPAPLQFGGPLMLGAEIMLNKQAFTGKEIVNDLTDDWWDRSAKIGNWAWKSWMPSAAYVPGSWYWERVSNAASGVRDWSGRPYDLPQAISSSVGVKLKPQDVREGFAIHGREFEKVERDLKSQMSRLGRDRARGAISDRAFKQQRQRLIDKMQGLNRKAQETFQRQ